MTRDVEFAYSRTFPAGVKRAFDELLAYELTRLFDRRYAAIPAVKAVRDQDGPWGTPGQTRTIQLAGGGSMHERLREAIPSKRFAYHLDQITGPMKALVSSIDGAWEFEKGRHRRTHHLALDRHPRGRLGALGDAGCCADVAGLLPAELREHRAPAVR